MNGTVLFTLKYPMVAFGSCQCCVSFHARDKKSCNVVTMLAAYLEVSDIKDKQFAEARIKAEGRYINKSCITPRVCLQNLWDGLTIDPD